MTTLIYILVLVLHMINKISGKWKMLVILAICGKPKRFNKIKAVTGISSQTLSRVIKELQEDMIVKKQSPYIVLTSTGANLCKLLTEIYNLT